MIGEGVGVIGKEAKVIDVAEIFANFEIFLDEVIEAGEVEISKKLTG